MKGLKIALELILIVFFQNIFARFIRIGGIAPELLFVFCICFAYFEKKSVYYVTVGAVCGVLAGVLSGCAPFWLAAYIICVLSVSALAEVLYNGPFLLIFPIVLVFSFLLNSAYFFAYHAQLGNITYFRAFMSVILPVMIYNTIASGIIGFFVRHEGV